MRSSVLTVCVLTACGGGGGASTLSSSAATGITPLGVAMPQAEPIGWLAIAPVAVHGDEVPYWVPVDDSAALLFLPEGSGEPAPERAIRAVPARGEPVELTFGGRRAVSYGCEDNALNALALHTNDGSALEPGPVWILPDTDAAATWAPHGLAVKVAQVDPKQRAWEVGSLTVALTVKDADHAVFAISQGASWLLNRNLERPVMAGADDAPIDLTKDTPGMPEVAAAFTMASNGSVLITLATPGYEGTSLSTLLYDGITVRDVEAMSHYLYSCAF
ncbi:MAG: hypothetical protein R3B48_26440 [Kofleriaceae bacterium]